MGAVAQLGLRPVGDTPWPTESHDARARRILDAAGLPYVIEAPAYGPNVAARDVDRVTAADLLTALANDAGAAVVDLPTGEVMYQAAESRDWRATRHRWRDHPGLEWQAMELDLTWSGPAPSIEAWPPPGLSSTLVIDPCAVEAEPTWSTTEATVVNSVRVEYGPPAAAGTDRPAIAADDTASIATHGRRHVALSTALAADSDALRLASRILSCPRPRTRPPSTRVPSSRPMM